LSFEDGLDRVPAAHFKRPVERPFRRDERERVTILYGGLTLRHDQLITSGMRGLGYRMAMVPTAAKADFQAGKEYGNNGQCSPTYFTVGSLVNYLKDLRDRQGMSTETILNDYVFFTAGACGPCRFGMYEAEYRLALRNSGFDGFRVLLFQQRSGLNQAEAESGLDFDMNFSLVVLNSLCLGDLLNEVAYHIRPYEVTPGSTDRALAECLELCQRALNSKDYPHMRGKWRHALLGKLLPGLRGADDVAKFLDMIVDDTFTNALNACRDLLNERVEVDYTRPRPIVKVTGEFWAQTTEGDGNYRMFSFLEREGAEALVEPIATWIGYLIHQGVQQNHDYGGLKEGEAPPAKRDWIGRLRRTKRYYARCFKLYLANRILTRGFEKLRHALGGTAHALVNQLELQRLGHPYYNSRARGGEGHLEVAKNIYYAHHHLAHMVLSLKPFGCMPSTQSDGAQAAVISHYPDMIYLPIETSGEGDVHAHSRVQMALGEAKDRCKEEFHQAVARSGYSLEQLRAYVGEHRELRRPIQSIPHVEGVVGRGANFLLHVASLMRRS
jgi:predicted nucleotide-binding protein (sugar kinase/HSP70/actin superfamily)